MTAADAGSTTVLPRGLSSDTCAALSGLVAEIAGSAPDALPWLAPALLFADPAIQAGLDLPRPGPGQVLVHEHQGLTVAAPLPLDAPLAARVETTRGASSAEYRFHLGDAVELATALRLFAVSDLAGAAPAPFRPQMLAQARMSGAMTVSQARTDRYLALSGDTNPIHHDRAEAARLGFAAPVVPGLLLLSLVQPWAGAALPGAVLTGLNCRFMSPLETDAPFRVALLPRGPGRARAFLLADQDHRALALVDLRLAA